MNKNRESGEIFLRIIKDKMNKKSNNSYMEKKLPSRKISAEKENYNSNIETNQINVLKRICRLKNNKKRKGTDPLNFHLDKIGKHLNGTLQNNLNKQDPFYNQTLINKRMRGILINWLIELNDTFELKKRTIFLTANIFDRYLQYKQIPQNKLQLVGTSAFIIASKFEDIYPPELDKICYFCEDIYSKNELIQTEGDILFFLNFNLIFVSSFDVLEYLIKVNDIEDQNLMDMSVMICKVYLYYPNSEKMNNSKLATFALNFAYLLLYSKDLEIYHGYPLQKNDTLFFLKKIQKLTNLIKADNLSALDKKYQGLYLKLIYSPYLFN
jgi:hypothetical protein